MSNEWDTVKLGDVSDFEGGSQPPKSKFVDAPRDGYIRLLQIRDFKSDKYAIYIPNIKKNRICEADDIMIGRYGASVGQIHRGKAGAYNVALIKTIPNEQTIDKNFFYLYLTSDLFQKPLMSVADRSAQAGFSKADIAPFEIPLPPLPEQKRIVAILDEAFAGIEKAIVNTQQNLANARELFESSLNTIFTQKGEGWEEKSMEEVAFLTRGHNPPKSKFSDLPKDNYVRFYQIRDGKSDKYTVYVPDSPQLHRVEPNDILMVAYRHIGNVFRGVSGAFNVALCKISNRNRNVILDDYLYYIIPTNFVKGELLKRSERSLIPSMSVNHLKEILIPVPPLKVQKEMVSNILFLEDKTQRLEAIYQQKLTALAELKQSLLQKAFSGELTTDDLPIKKEAAA